MSSHPTYSTARYVWGLCLCLLLTLVAFLAVVQQWLTGWYVVFLILGLALIQAAIQLKFFLHVGEETEPRWQFVAFWFTVLVVFILVGGSLWIMYNLNHRVMPMGAQL
jgi:cytochrome o ubiquinol oxidase operon protein cyoD